MVFADVVRASARKFWRPALTGLALLVVAIAAAAGVVRLPIGPGREVVIETDDPQLEVVVQDERFVRLVDPKSGKAYQLDRRDLTLGLDADGLSMALEGERPIHLKRQGQRIATVRLQGQHEARAATGTAPAAPSRRTGVQQVQLGIFVAQVESTQARRLTTRWLRSAKKEAGSPSPSVFAVLADVGGLQQDLEDLSTEGQAQIMAKPTLITLSGRPATFSSGGEIPLFSTASGKGKPNVSSKEFGTTVNCLAVVLNSGKIHLEVASEITALENTPVIDRSQGNPQTIPSFRTQRLHVAEHLVSGQTLVITSPSMMGPAATANGIKAKQQDLVLLVTPRLVNPFEPTPSISSLPTPQPAGPNGSSKRCYVIIDGQGNGEQVVVIPWSKDLTVHGALQEKNAAKLVPSGARVWISRPCEQGSRHTMMPVEWSALVNDRNHMSNHRLEAGDRVYVQPVQPYAEGR
jgi:hypothetical protein